jgi:DNA ligase D-like protein (predicted 3'-phosphoesterase)
VSDPRFVIHKHDASSLHYDFRLEVDGTLKSWAVPKGPSTDPREKRLAVQVEDHRLGYGDFEGVIEDGYGQGTVLVWDTGSYRNLDEDPSMSQALAAGHVRIWRDGQKLTGGYTLQRMRAGSGLSGERIDFRIVAGSRADIDELRDLWCYQRVGFRPWNQSLLASTRDSPA